MKIPTIPLRLNIATQVICSASVATAFWTADGWWAGLSVAFISLGWAGVVLNQWADHEFSDLPAP